MQRQRTLSPTPRAAACCLCLLIPMIGSGRAATTQEPAAAETAQSKPIAAEKPAPYAVQPLAPIPPATTYRAEIPEGALSPRIVDYDIKATLDPAESAKSVTGSEVITWRNPSDIAVGELQFHLYLNAFRDDESTFAKESGGQLRGDEMPEGGYGNIEITSMKTAAGEDLLPGLEFIQPDDGNPNDRTVARVPLPQPVPPGGSIQVSVDFVSKLPRVFARTGFKDNFFFVAQWYPKLGVFEPRGMRGRAEPGWNCHQFHANSEFYADFGTFSVQITTPSNFVVGATGALVDEKQIDGGMIVRTYRQADVHDFAWTADDNYVVGRRTYEEEGFPRVEVTALVQPENATLVERHLDDCIASLRWFNREIGPYPYSTLTVVDPEYGAAGAGGMEYPTLITAGLISFSPGAMPPEDMPALEMVIFHEFGHQYWYGMVASNEFEEPWLDEGINSYTEMLGMEATWPDNDAIYFQYGGLNLFELPVPFPQFGRSYRMAAMPFVVNKGPLINTSWGFKGGYNYGINSYSRPAVTLKTLEGYVGRETMKQMMRTYFERWRFRHPTSQDFFDVANEVSGQDLSWFFDQYFRQGRVLDYAVQSVKEIDDGARTEIILERRGDAIFPITALVTMNDGTTRDLDWDGRSAWQVFTIEGPEKVSRVVIDPEERIWLEANVTNNSYVSSPDPIGPMRVSSQFGLLFEHVLVLLAGAV